MSEYGKAIFSQWELEFAVWNADADGNFVDGQTEPQWIGGLLDRMEIEQKFQEERADIPGNPFPNWRQLEEDNALKFENTWMAAYSKTLPVFKVPSFPRNAQYCIVMLFTDEDTGAWLKRTYFGAQFEGVRLSSQNQIFMGSFSVHASYFVQQYGFIGTGAAPDLFPFTDGVLRYVDASGAPTDLFSYDFETEIYTPIAPAAGLIDFLGDNGTYEFRMLIDGQLALGVDIFDTLHANTFTCNGPTYTANLPRAEWMVRGMRIASLSKDGELAIPTYTSATDNPNVPLSFTLNIGAGGTWLASLALSGLYCDSLNSTL